MSELVTRLPMLSLGVGAEPAGPLSTRPFGRDSLIGMVPCNPGLPEVDVDPVTQLSRLNGEVLSDRADGTNCNTESDGQDQIAVDIDFNDD